MKDIVLVGAGGHCKSCIDVIEQTGLYNIVGLVDKPELIGTKLLGYEIKWSDDQLPKLAKQYENFIVTVGHIISPLIRIKLFKLLKELNVNIPSIISHKAYISKHSKIGEGTILFHGVVVNADAKIGDNCIVNSKSLIEHDVVIGDNCHISTNSVVNGGVCIGDNVFYGSGTISKEYISIADDVLIAGASFVRKNIKQSGVYAGNPVKRYK